MSPPPPWILPSAAKENGEMKSNNVKYDGDSDGNNDNDNDSKNDDHNNANNFAKKRCKSIRTGPKIVKNS